MIQAKRVHVKQEGRGRKLVRLLVLFIGIYLIWLLIRGIVDIRQAYRRIDEAKVRLNEAQTRNEELKRKMADVQTKEYVERVARNELLMQKPGETVVVIQTFAPASSEEVHRKEEKELPNYQKWWNLIN